MLNKIPLAYRKYLYQIVLAAGPLVLLYGLASSEEVAVWTGLLATVLQTPASTVALKNLTPDETRDSSL